MTEGRLTIRADAGFSLVEILIAMAILAVVTAGVFSVYNTQRKVADTETEVVDVQQNMRLAMQSIMKDLRMSGLLLSGVNPVQASGDGAGANGTDTITINTSTANGAACRIDADLTASVTAGTGMVFTVSSANELEGLSVGDSVRIINPGERSQPAATVFAVAARDTAARTVTVTPAASTGITDFKRGFVMVRTGPGAPDTFPNTIVYCVGPSAGCAPAVTSCPANQCLMRIVNGSADDGSIVASNISDIQFRYVVDGSTVESSAPADLAAVRDVRVDITGRTYDTAQAPGSERVREMTALARIRNR